MGQPLEVATYVRNGWLVVSVIGALDNATADGFRDRIVRLASALARPRVVLEFSALDCCDSAGLNALMLISQELHHADGTLILASPGTQLSRMLQATGLDRRVKVCPDVRHAVSVLSAEPARP